MPDNPAITGIPAAIAAAAQAHGAPEAVVVMVVQPGERNAYDQQWIQANLWEKHRVRTVRRSLKELSEEASLGPNSELLLSSPGGGAKTPVSVVYFRAG